MSEVILRGGTIVTVDTSFHIASGDVAAKDGVLVQVGGTYTPATRDYEIIDAEGCIVMPGLVQSHVHTCQTLARGRADDLELLDWLKQVIWPYEAALSAEDLAASARLAMAELLLSGTTAILDMGTVRHTEAIFEVAKVAGIRATIGKAMMDAPDTYAGLHETTAASLRAADRLREAWHGAEGGRLRYAYTPRFVLSCTEELLREVGVRARQAGVRIHTHASENRAEIAEVRRRFGRDNIEYLRDVGLVGSDVALAHCIWLTETERAILAETGTHVLHCPSCNFKLASGIAEIPELMALGIPVSIGCDGAPCNNNLDGFAELRLAALAHKPRAGATALRAPLIVRMATLGGARALGLDEQIGSLEVGKRADVICIDTRRLHIVPSPNPYSALAYAVRGTDVRDVVVDGRVVVRDRALLTMDVAAIIEDARARAHRIFATLSPD